MPLDFTNTNLLWCSVMVETLQRLGLSHAVVCPGSRSAPLTIAFAQHQHQINVTPVLDERSASFFALGLARRSGQATALVCTSGTAAANFYPAIIEAAESRVPLLVMTADRPPELRHCRAGQTIDQQKLYGTYPNWYAELALPQAEMSLLAYLRQTLIHAWERTRWPVLGPVHLNVPFRDPLAPLPDSTANDRQLHALKSHLQVETFFRALSHVTQPNQTCDRWPNLSTAPLPDWLTCDRGLIIAGPTQPLDPIAYCTAIGKLSHHLQWPVLAEGLSPLRNHASLNPHLVSTYDLILRNPSLANDLQPQMVLCLGELPISKELRSWLEQSQPLQWIVNTDDRDLDSSHGQTTHLRLSIEQLVNLLKVNSPCLRTANSSYLQTWLQAEQQVRQTLDRTLHSMDRLFEGKIPWLLSQQLPEGTPLLIANSTPVRDVEWFWQPNDRQIRPFFNRGANGIDGTLSTALGIAHQGASTVLLTGDLALLHDTNGFLLRQKLQGHLTIVLINNHGGGIFEMLPIANFDPPFEEFFATPQAIDFETLCSTYGVSYKLIPSWTHLSKHLNPLPNEGIRLLEIRTDRHTDAQWRQTHLTQIPMG